MRKYLLLLVILTLSLFGFAQTSSQTRTANLFNWNGNPYLNLWDREGSQYVAADDNSYAYSKKLSSGRSSLLLVLQDFRFEIPASATIGNITVRIRRFKTGKGNIRDYAATLLKAGSSFYSQIQYGVHWINQINYPGTESEFLYTQAGAGSNGGTQGNASYEWTPALINDAAFGVRIVNDSPTGSVTVYYDLVDITVNFTEAAITRKAPETSEIKPLKEPSVFPNPITTQTTIQFTAVETGQSVVELYNSAGVRAQVLYSGAMLAGQLYTIRVGEMQLQKGFYIYSIRNGKYRYSGKIIKLD